MQPYFLFGFAAALFFYLILTIKITLRFNFVIFVLLFNFFLFVFLLAIPTLYSYIISLSPAVIDSDYTNLHVPSPSILWLFSSYAMSASPLKNLVSMQQLRSRGVAELYCADIFLIPEGRVLLGLANCLGYQGTEKEVSSHPEKVQFGGIRLYLSEHT